MKENITPLDLYMVGPSGLPQQLSRLGAAVDSLRDYSNGSDAEVAVAQRENVAANPSFEFFAQTAPSLPLQWSVDGGAALTADHNARDGLMSLRLPSPGASAVQYIALPGGGYVASLYARAAGAVGQINIDLTGVETVGPLYREDVNGTRAETNEVPADGNWYRFWRPSYDSAPVSLGVLISNTAGDLYIDSVKVEVVPGSQIFPEPSPFSATDLSAAVFYRIIYADHITTGTLTVGGVNTSAPKLRVLDVFDQELVVIGEDGGYRGVHVKGSGGIRISGSGSVEVTGTGRILSGNPAGARTEISISGIAGYDPSNTKQVELSTLSGRIRILAPRGLIVEGGGSLVVGDEAGARTEVRDYGVVGYNAAGQVIFGLNEVGAVGSLDIENGDVIIGNGGASYAFWDNSAGRLKVRGDIEASNIYGGLIDGATINGSNFFGGEYKVGSVYTPLPDYYTVQMTAAGVSLLPYNGSTAEAAFSWVNSARLYNYIASSTSYLEIRAQRQADAGLGIPAWGQLRGEVRLIAERRSQASPPATQAIELRLVPTAADSGADLTQNRVELVNVRRLSIAADGVTLREAIRDNNDGWLRFNQSGNYNAGLYTPGAFRIDGGISVVGTAASVFGGHVTATNGLTANADLGTNTGNGFFRRLANDNALWAITSDSVGPYIVASNYAWTVEKPLRVFASYVNIKDKYFFGEDITLNGRVGVNETVQSWASLLVDGLANSNSTYSIVSRNLANSNLFYSRNDGQLWANQAWTIGSDARLKEEVEDLPEERQLARRVRFRKYRRKLGGKLEYGVVAQELREVFPELVVEIQHPGSDEIELAVDYTGLAVLQGKVLQELDDELTQAKRQAREQVERLEARLIALENIISPRRT